MANNYETFEQVFQEYATYSDGASKAADGKISLNLKRLAASTTDDERVQQYLLRTRNAEGLYNVLKTASENKKENIDNLVSSNLESIVNEMPEDEVSIGIMNLEEPKKEYSGNNADVYKEISKLQKDYTKMAQVIQSKDLGKMNEYVKEFYENKYNSDEKKSQLKIINALIDVDKDFVAYFYQEDFKDKNQKFVEKLEQNKEGYFYENIKDKDFIETYSTIKSIKTNMERESQRNEQRSNYRRAA
jgi:hypothetical protein